MIIDSYSFDPPEPNVNIIIYLRGCAQVLFSTGALQLHYRSSKTAEKN